MKMIFPKKHIFLIVVTYILLPLSNGTNAEKNEKKKENKKIFVNKRSNNNSTHLNTKQRNINKLTNVVDAYTLFLSGENYLNLDEHNDIVLVLGNTGSGKSTLTQFIAGDNTKLKSVEVEAGTGEYIIIDNNDKIGHGIFSKTVIPEKVIEPKSDTAYFDCPGFSDTRNAAFDIASTYFVKKTIDHAKSVKLVLTISYPSLRVGVDRNDFMKLIKHTTELIKNINKFKNSIALVVTKVDNEYINHGKTLVTDDIVKNKIIRFIRDAKQTIKGNIKYTNKLEEKQFYESAINLMDIFLKKRKSKYTNIALFRRPSEEGLISEIQILQEGRKIIKNLIENTLVFTKKTEYDFGFTISSSSRNSILQLVDKINEEITKDILNTTNDMIESYSYKPEDIYDIYELKEQSVLRHKNITNLVRELDQSGTYKEFLIKFINFINNIDFKNSRNVFLSLFNKHKYLNFLKLISNADIKPNPSQWARPLQNVVDYISQSRSWYIFLDDMLEKLSYYTAYTEMQETNFNSKLVRQKRNIDSKDIDTFFKKVKDYKIIEYNNVNNMEKDSIKLKELNKILNSLYKNEVKVSCIDSESLLIKGDFVRFSDVPSNNPCSKKIKSLQIFALNSIFIDKDLIENGNKLTVLIISPKWEIIGDRKIVLDGTPGAALPEKKAVRSQDGRPGLPGGTAGSLIGIGQKIINAEHLSISANGGSGSPGQDGGDGLPGINMNTKEPQGSLSDGEEIMAKSRYSFVSSVNRKTADSILEIIGYALGFYSNMETRYYLIHGQNGTKGHNGCKGGAGGKGGLGGIVSFYGLDKSSGISILNNNGGDGKPGNGGKGGKGGDSGDNVYIMHKQKESHWLNMKTNSENRAWHVTNREQNNKAADGKDNTQISYKNIKNPENVPTIENAAYKFNNYKIYLLQSINNNANKHNIIKFYFHFNNNPNINNLYDSLVFFNELQSLESLDYKLSNKVDLVTFYQSLLSRISIYAKKPKNYELTTSHKILLNSLYTATLSKIISLKGKSEGNLIINIDGYFLLMVNNFEKLQKYENEIVKNEYNVNFKEQIDIKIAEATLFIENHIALEIDTISSRIDQIIDLLIDEIIELQAKSKAQKQELIGKQKDLVNLIKQRSLFESLNFIANILNFAGTIGRFVNVIVQANNRVPYYLNLEKEMNVETKFSIPEGVHYLRENGTKFAENFLQKKLESLQHTLKALNSSINDYPNELNGLKSIVFQVETNITSIARKKNFDLLKTMNLVEIVKNILTNKYAAINKNNTSISTKLLPAISNILQILNTTSTAAEVFTDVYLKYKDNNNKFEKFNEAIQTQENNIGALRNYQLQIYQTIMPMFKAMGNDIKKYEKELPSKSRVALDVSKWKIQDSFKDMKVLLGKITNEFKMQDELKCFIDKLDEAMSALVNVYDQIQNYNEQKELADYIAVLNSDSFMDIKTDNKTIDNALIGLEYITKSSIVLDQFEKAMNSFKQFIFPFANYYLDEYELPFHMNAQPNIEQLLVNATKKINNLKLKLAENNLLLNRNFDQYVFEEYFQTGTKFRGPFFVWDSYSYGNTISKLLSGEEIVLKSDVLNSIHNKNAIKFNKIEINLSSRDKVLSSTLEEKLNFFDVTMKHFGNSYYRCDNKFYLLSSDTQTFYYSFEKDINGEPVRKNQVYSKIKNGQYMLSPYATWSFQLKDSLNTNFSELESLKGKVDLELIGFGQYISAENQICGRDLKKYYKVDDTISITDAIYEGEIISRESFNVS